MDALLSRSRIASSEFSLYFVELLRRGLFGAVISRPRILCHGPEAGRVGQTLLPKLECFEMVAPNSFYYHVQAWRQSIDI